MNAKLTMLICLFLSIVIGSTQAQETVHLGDSLKITVPEEFVRIVSNDFPYQGATEDGRLLIVQKIATDNFDVGKVFKMGDEIAFNLKAYDKVDDQSDGFFDFGKDYCLKEYADKESGSKLYTYTSYMKGFPYVILYIPTAGDANMKTALSTIQSTIDDSGDTWWQRVSLLFKRSWWAYLTIGFVMALLLSATNNTFVYWVIVAAGCWIFNPVWGDWMVFIPVMAAFMITMYIFKCIPLSDWGSGNGSGGDSVDFDFDF